MFFLFFVVFFCGGGSRFWVLGMFSGLEWSGFGKTTSGMGFLVNKLGGGGVVLRGGGGMLLLVWGWIFRSLCSDV